MTDSSRQKGKSILVIEDEPAHAEAIRRYLTASDSDCTIILASSLKEFHRITELTTPDLVIADINLPDGSAFSLLRSDMERQPWPVLVMTSFGDEETAVKAIKSGALDYIVKSPDAFKNIVHVVRKNLREWKAIQKSRESENRFRILFETMNEGVVYQDVNGRITASNPAAEKMTGFTLEEMQDMQFFDPGPWLDILPDGSLSKAGLHPAMTALRSGIPVKDRVMGIHNPRTDKLTWVLVNAVPQFRPGDTQPFQVFTTFTDITEMKLAESDLKEAKKKAEESDRLKSVFMANMSHEIRTPMNGILGFADLLKTPELSGESQKMYIDAITSSGKRMLDIINDLIDISRIEAGQIELKKENTNITALLHELILFFNPEANKKRIELRTDIHLPSGEYIIETDRTRLSQIITNLLKNALKFTQVNGYIELGCRLQGDSTLLFSVKDNGPGIREELQQKIFERFRQGDRADEHEGVGLGLAISKAYVEMLGGKMNLESEPGNGSVFSFTHPLVIITPVPGKADEKAPPVEAKPGLCILVAEDDDLSYTLLKETLKRANIGTCRARTGVEAVDIVRRNGMKINLILMDIKLPLLNGIEATRQIKKINPDIPVIAQSAYVSQTEIQRSLDAGCDDYITKPVDIKLLVEKIMDYSGIKHS